MINSVAAVLSRENKTNSLPELIFLTGRTENYREKTNSWLINSFSNDKDLKSLIIAKNIRSSTFRLIMRGNKDWSKSHEYKLKMMQDISQMYNVKFLFDDDVEVCRIIKTNFPYINVIGIF